MRIISRAEAKAQGLKYFYTGELCMRGHQVQRLTSNGGCITCLKAYDGARNARVKAARALKPKHPKKVRDKAKRAAYQKQWTIDNAERQKKNIQAWRERNKERTAQTNAEWLEANREAHNQAVRRLKAQHPERTRIYAHNRRARLAEAGELDSGVVRRLWDRQGGRCACPCRADLRKGYHLDHILALVRGGLNTEGNVQLLTPLCNLNKGTKDNTVFMLEQKAKYP